MLFRSAGMEMNNLSERRAFNLGLWCGIVLFVVLNVLNYSNSRDCFLNSEIDFLSGDGCFSGFPLLMYNGGLASPNGSNIIWSGLIGNILIALVFSFVLGLIFNFVSSKIFSRRSPLK